MLPAGSVRDTVAQTAGSPRIGPVFRGPSPARIICAVAAIVAAHAGARAQSTGLHPDEVVYRPSYSYTIENGLPQNSVNALAQARDGALWIATYGGLARHTGADFQTWSLRDTPQLRSNFLCSLLVDRSDRLWIGSAEASVACMDGRTVRGYGIADGVPHGRIGALCELADGTILAGGETGIARFDGARFVPLLAAGAEQPRVVRSLLEHAGALWCAGNDGVWRVRDGTALRTGYADGVEYQSASYLGVHPDRGLWARTGRGLALVRDDSLVHLAHQGAEPAQYMVAAAAVNKDGGLLLATGESVVVARLEDSVAMHTPTMLQQMDGASILLDRESNLWIGSRTRGLAKLVRSFMLPIEQKSLRLPPGQLLFCAAGRDRAWIASSEGRRVLQLDLATLQVMDAAPEQPAAGRVQGLLRARDGALWILRDGSLQVQRESGLTTIEASCGGYTAPLFEDDDGDIWIGGRGKVLRVHADALETLVPPAGLPQDAEVASIAQDALGRMWFGSSSGLLLLEGDRWSCFGADAGFGGGIVRSLLPRADGSLWAGVYGGGMVRWKDGRTVVVAREHGLYDDFISRIEAADDGHLWLNSNRGVFRVRASDLDAVADGKLDAVACLAAQTGEGNGIGGVALASGRMLFATVRGLAIVDPSRVVAAAPPPGVELRTLSADGVVLAPAAHCAIPPGPRELVFHFAGVSLTEPQALRYRYRLSGFDPGWRTAGTEALARYTNVPPGNYRFEVFARSYDGAWSSAPAAMELELEPYAHETAWFRAAAALAVAGAAWGAFRVRSSQARRRQAELQREVDLRRDAEDSLRGLTGRLIRAQEEERLRIARELHDHLGQRLALLGVGIDMLERGERAKAEEGVAGELRELSGAVKSIASDVHGLSVQLHSTQLDKLGLRAALRSLCKEVSHQHELAVEYESEGDAAEPGGEAGLGLYRIAQESLRNAIRHGDASSVQVRLRLVEAGTELVVSDDGCGFDARAADAADGLGLRGMHERMRLLGGKLELDSAPGRGTRISASVPRTRERTDT